MESQYSLLAETIRKEANAHPKPRYLVAIAGIPGSGKTTAAQEVVYQLNQASPKAVILSMDGFHLSRAALDQLPDPKEAHIRRGAPWTFDVNRFVSFVRQLRTWADDTPLACPGSETWSDIDILRAPTFDHEAKDPVENGISVTPDASIIILEGNYLLLNEPGWQEIAELADYRVFVDTDPQEARGRLAQRHLRAGIEKTLEEGYRRVDCNDFLNAILIREKLLAPDMILRSVAVDSDT
jgi:pantothenate kinase